MGFCLRRCFHGTSDDGGFEEFDESWFSRSREFADLLLEDLDVLLQALVLTGEIGAGRFKVAPATLAGFQLALGNLPTSARRTSNFALR